MFAIDVSFVQRVVIASSLNITKAEQKFNPILGFTKIENTEQIILDLNSVVINEAHQAKDTTDSYFSLLHEKINYLVPVDTLLGVFTTFQEEFIPCEESDTFLEANGCCRHKFNDEKISSTLYIVENDFLINLLTQDNIKNYIKTLNVQKTDLED